MQTENISYEKLLEQLALCVEREIHRLLEGSLEESLLRGREKEKRQRQKAELRNYLARCGTGDWQAKEYCREIIAAILTEQEGVGKENIENWIPFSRPENLQPMHMFQILLYVETKQKGADGFSSLIEKAGWLLEENCITEVEVEGIYQSWLPHMDFMDRLKFLVEQIYSMLYGLGCIDSLLEQHLDGISGGVSNGGTEERSVWVQWKGRSVHLCCMKFGSVQELIRICRRICRFEQRSQFTRERGYLVCELAEGSRIVVTRPPFSESWSFFVRKFDTIEKRDLEYLIQGRHRELVIEFLKRLILDHRTIAITGEQGSGKTTLLVALIGCMEPELTLRIQEMNFELHIRKYFPERNCITFRETETISTQEGLDLQKKTDGTVNILGEVATHEAGSYMIQMGMTASLFTLFTHHAKSTKNLILALRNSLLLCGQFSNEEAAVEQVTNVVHFDVHLVKDKSGRRYVERITEIIPSERRDGTFQLRDRICWNAQTQCYEESGERYGSQAMSFR